LIVCLEYLLILYINNCLKGEIKMENNYEITHSRELDLLKESVDLHFHSAPAVFPRIFDHAGAVDEASKRGLKALVLKDHYYPSYDAAYFIRKYIHTSNRPFVFGGLALNNSVGGVNPFAVDVALKADVKIIWMPTVSSKNHIDHHSAQKSNFKFPKSSYKLLVEKPITIIDSEGKLKREVNEVLDVITKKPDVIIANGHLSYAETKALFERAHKIGISKLLINHPTFLMDCSAEDLKLFTKKGVFIEHSAGMIHPESSYYSIPVEKLVHYIKTVGIDNTIISSDLGQANHPLPIEGMVFVVKSLLEEGFSESEIHKLVSQNASSLLGI